MDTPAQGSCQCGAIQLTVNSAPLLTYACFCSSCQKRTGSAFSMGLVVDAVVRGHGVGLAGTDDPWVAVFAHG